MTEDSAINKRRKDVAQKGYVTEGQLDAAQARREKSKQQKKGRRRNRLYMAGGGLLLVVLVLVYGCQPAKGTRMYGVCKTFLELMTDYPETLRIQYVEQYPLAVRIGYTDIDAAGQFSLDMIECAFRSDPQTVMAIEAVQVNRRDLDPAGFKKFNESIPGILASRMDLTLPQPLGKTLLELKKD